MLIGNMKVMIPTGKILSSSIRPITDIITVKTHRKHVPTSRIR